jgi:hypothetical protein
MLSWPEAQAAGMGLKRLLRFDKSFVQWFDRSPAGARRSFRLMIPAIPFFLIMHFADASLAPEISSGFIIATTVIYFVLTWVSFPLLLIAIGRLIEREGAAIAAIAPYNWFNFSLTVIGCIFSLIDSAGLLGGSIGAIFWMLTLASIVYEIFLLATASGIGYGGAVLLAIVDFVLAQSFYLLVMMPIMSTTLA